jgi:hypothetical protein
VREANSDTSGRRSSRHQSIVVLGEDARGKRAIQLLLREVRACEEQAVDVATAEISREDSMEAGGVGAEAEARRSSHSRALVFCTSAYAQVCPSCFLM